MSASAPGCKSEVVGELLSHLTGILHGLIDTGTAMCAGSPFEPTDRLLKGRRLVLEAILVLLPEFLGTCTYQDPIKSQLEHLNDECHSLAESLRKLSRFRDLDDEGLRQATNLLAMSFLAGIESVQSISVTTKIRVRFLESLSVERRQWYRHLLDRLFDVFTHARSLGSTKL